MEEFAKLHKKAKLIELNLDGKFKEADELYSQLNRQLINARHGRPVSVVNQQALIETIFQEIANLLKDLDSSSDELRRITNPDELSSSDYYSIQRHAEMSENFISDSIRMRENFTLLFQDIQLAVSGELELHGSGHNKKLELSMKENEHLLSSTRLIDDQISIAVETRDQLMSQRLNMKKLQTRIHDIASNFPIVNNLVHRINFKKRRDTIIIGIIVCICTFVLLSYAFN